MSKTPRVIIFWLSKRCRKPKQLGLATAVGSAAIIHSLANRAVQGEGRLYIVEARNAEYGRQLISASKGGQSAEIGAPAMKTVLADGRIVAIGMSACLAIAGAADAIQNWDARIAKRGRVTEDESRALRSDPFKTWNLPNAFGQGLTES